ncbi:hypothetical protein [Klebsiella variicola]|uniref:hypothetical protein n=1 Tax=Klebsiella variicola TaxID=244366 RepID=UPI0009B94CDB|nr:hypothetical protein [Klebsiella variicola]
MYINLRKQRQPIQAFHHHIAHRRAINALHQPQHVLLACLFQHTKGQLLVEHLIRQESSRENARCRLFNGVERREVLC